MLEKYSVSDRDSWCWDLAQLEDVADIVAMAEGHFQTEIDGFFTPDPRLFAKNVASAIIKQMYSYYMEQVLVARHKTDNRLMAYSWLSRGAYTTYAREEMAEARFAHVDLALRTRQRITLVAQMLIHWSTWCEKCAIPVLVSTSIREKQTVFMRLHEEAGFTLRGSVAYLKCVK
jgi:hypothetical protein